MPAISTVVAQALHTAAATVLRRDAPPLLTEHQWGDGTDVEAVYL